MHYCHSITKDSRLLHILGAEKLCNALGFYPELISGLCQTRYLPCGSRPIVALNLFQGGNKRRFMPPDNSLMWLLSLFSSSNRLKTSILRRCASLGPNKPKHSPFSTSKSTSSTANRSLNFLVKLWVLIITIIKASYVRLASGK